ncbi:MAG TPA: CoA-binding protein [Candidatus Krumholzibacteria bacterium]|nr:CoA-binding protein [Candidatus Krumholzibacteria bacterium]HPD70971.1 CoA-binding protein [Candidatus Krumholzibacteria bacterium]HRY39329.1 CoA-binding protein [Candidatus Krumholzibacteria bacterium]
MDDLQIRRILTGMRRVAVVGLSPNPERASHGIARWLAGRGLEVVGVNPGQSEILGIPVYPKLEDVPGPVDVVDIFRRSDTVGPVVSAAVARGDGAIWMQEGVVNDAAAETAAAAGIPVVMDRCIYKEWLRLLNG